MKSRFKNKKGFVNYLLMFGIIALAVAITMVLSGNIMNEFNEEIQASDDFSDIAKEEHDYLNSSFATTFDSLPIVVLITYMVMSILFAVATRVSPIFVFVLVFLALGLLTYPMLLSNIFNDFISSNSLDATNYPITVFILSNFPFVYIGYILLVGLTYVFANRF